LQSRQPLSQRVSSVAVRRFGFLQAHTHEGNRLPWPKLSDAVKIGTYDLGNLRIAADGLAVYSQDNALTVAGHLHRAGADGLGNQFMRWKMERRPPQTNAHAIARGCYAKRGLEQIVRIEPIGLGSIEKTKNDRLGNRSALILDPT